MQSNATDNPAAEDTPVAAPEVMVSTSTGAVHSRTLDSEIRKREIDGLFERWQQTQVMPQKCSTES